MAIPAYCHISHYNMHITTPTVAQHYNPESTPSLRILDLLGMICTMQLLYANFTIEVFLDATRPLQAVAALLVLPL